MEKWFPIRTPRLVLREFRGSDEKDVHEYASDPVVSQYVTWGPNSVEKTREILESRIVEQEHWPRLDVTLAVELRAEEKVVGSLRLAVVDQPNRTGDFGFAFNRKYWNRGYATEASKALLTVAFSALKLHRVVATCDVRNVGSRRVMEKIGMRREGHFLQDLLQRSEWRDSYLFAILEP